jgi:hypothetical protein
MSRDGIEGASRRSAYEPMSPQPKKALIFELR